MAIRFSLRGQRLPVTRSSLALTLYLCLLSTAVPALDNATAGGTSPPPVPLTITSSEIGNSVEGQVKGRLDASFAELAAILASPAQWCAIISLHLNIKSCVFETSAKGVVLRVYTGRKQFQTPDDASAILAYLFAVDRVTADELRVTLMAEEGPNGTSDHRLALIARPESSSATLIQLSYSYKTSQMNRASLRLYLATAGRHKVGFTVVDQRHDGQPIYVAGMRGLIERNAVRYYFAIVTQLASDQQRAPGKADAWRAEHWYDLTQQYPLQLHELDKQEYLHNKLAELAEQKALQAQLTAR